MKGCKCKKTCICRQEVERRCCYTQPTANVQAVLTQNQDKLALLEAEKMVGIWNTANAPAGFEALAKSLACPHFHGQGTFNVLYIPASLRTKEWNSVENQRWVRELRQDCMLDCEHNGAVLIIGLRTF